MPFYTASKPTFELAGREFPRVTWWKEPGMRGLYLRLMFVVLTSATNGYDGSMMNGLQALNYWVEYFHKPTPSQLGLLNAIMSAGSICALPFAPYSADYLGRRTSVTIGCSICIVGCILQTIGANYAMFVGARFLLGFGIAISHGAAPLLITELVHPQHRAIYTTIYNCTWYFGSIIAAWLTFGTLTIQSNWAWRAPSIIQAFPSLLQISFIWFVPESPRWHCAKGHPEKAMKTLADNHAQGNPDDEVVQLEFKEIQQTIALEQEFEGNGWQELIKTKGNRHRLVILVSLGFFSQWSGNGLFSYYMNIVLEGIGVESAFKRLYINGILNIVNFITALTFCFFVDKFGRRPLFLFATGGMCLSFMVWTICAQQFIAHGSKVAGNIDILAIFVFYVFYNSAWSGLLVGYGVEILPYRIRAKGLTILFLAVDLALFFNSYVNPIAMMALTWKYYMIYTIWLAVEFVVVYIFYIETRNTPLEEIVKYFDGEDAVLGGDAATEKSHDLLAKLDLPGTHTSGAQFGGDDEKNIGGMQHRETPTNAATEI